MNQWTKDRVDKSMDLVFGLSHELFQYFVHFKGHFSIDFVIEVDEKNPGSFYVNVHGPLTKFVLG